MTNRRQYASQRLLQMPKTKLSSVLVADGEVAKSGAPVAIYQVMLFDGASCFLMVGRVRASEREEYLPEFRAMARSLKQKRPIK